MTDIIETKDLTKKFNGKIAVDNINLEVEQGIAFGFLGPNGAGKTTTVRLLNGIIKPETGSAKIFGLDVEKNSHEIRKRCGVQTDTNLYERLTGYENLYIWGLLYEIERRKLIERIDMLLSIFNLKDIKDEPVGIYSKGMKQKLAIARAMINEPEILFLDEPTAGLDPESTDEILKYLKKYVKDGKRTIFLCSHRLEEVEFLCEMIAIIYCGKILIKGKISDIVKELWQDEEFIIELQELKGSCFDKLKNIKYLKSFNYEGNILTVLLSKKDSIPDLIDILISSGARIFSIENKKHSLKDIYFKLIPKENR